MAVPEPDPDAVYEHTELGKCLGDVLNDLVERGALPFAARTDTMKIEGARGAVREERREYAK